MNGIIDYVTNNPIISTLVVLIIILMLSIVFFWERFKIFMEDIMVDKWVLSGLSALLIVLLVILLLVMLSSDIALLVGDLVGTASNERHKINTILLLGCTIGGVVVVIGSAVLNRLSKAQMNAAKAQVDIAMAQVEHNRLVEKGNTQVLFKTATEHLGHEKGSVRIAAFYEFLYLIKGNGEEYRKSILDILYAYMRTITNDFARREDVIDAEGKGEPIKLTEEIQGLLDILFKSQDIDRSDIKLNLQRVYFSGADLANGDLSNADLRKADLSKADLSKAKLSGADLSEAKLSGAKLSGADLSGADLSEANLSGANLSEVNLSEARLLNADLSGADLSGASLFRADLFRADLFRADLFSANLFSANLFSANLSEADLSEADLSGADLSGAGLSGADLSGANLSDARLENASYTNETKFPKWLEEWLESQQINPDNDGKKHVPAGFVAPTSPRIGE